MNVIVDTGCANLASLANAVKRLGGSPVVSRDAATIRAARRVFLPGVGTAGAAMAALEQSGLDQLLPTLTQPVLGICLGMQLLTRFSEESARPCLGLLDDAVLPLEAPRLPHMGWNRLTAIAPHPLLAGIGEQDWFYFVHSFAAPPGRNSLALCQHGQPFSAVLGKGNFLGCQFHPERSGRSGAKLLKNFLEKDPC
ncbi:imidazole glycerol phosphate synthase subunit HisH [Gallaecimonas sp. GXIMD4217]|uniref:imidazole glycerol phosphate synthase subunit HisH n=1 Tax=Gallaecimonas sp. GXIMD4217 TaxID=3131927 RepID=UPI00311B3440